MKKLQILLLLLIFNISNFTFAQDVTEAQAPKKDEASSGVNAAGKLAPENYFEKEDHLIMVLLSRYHYKKTDINDSLSSRILDRYIKTLDYNRLYFLASDITGFEKYRYELDDDLNKGRLQPAYDMFNTFMERMKERQSYIHAALQKEFDFSKDESYTPERKDVPWARDKNELDELWRKRLKDDALREKLKGKDWAKISETLEKRYSNLEKRMLQLKSEDVFQLFMNQFTESIDPHTNYLSPITSENFKMQMSLSLEGIGASLMSEDEYTKVAEVIPGGPAYKSKLLKVNDKIVGVAQGEEGEMVDVINKSLDDVVKLIRGPKGTLVRLQILPADAGVNAKPKEIKILRDKVKLEEQAAKKDVITITRDGAPYKVGVITLPAFYFDYEAQARGEKDYKSTTKDVKKLLQELKDEKVDGVVLDLRNNGGGSLQEAIDLTGLFIKDGPVVQVRNADGSVEVGTDHDGQVFYDGPLAVLVNRSSASASEIFAGAIQDYKRGVIVGEQTYGKGTVQNLIDLNRFPKDPGIKYGQLKVTIAKFYRIDGGSTQRKGVIPDIKFPSMIDTSDYGESSEPSALPWDRISPSQYDLYTKLGDIVPELNKRHEARMKTDPIFSNFYEEIEEAKEDREQKTVSLNEAKRKKEQDEQEEKRLKSINERRQAEGLKLLKKGEVEPQGEKLSDPLLKETANIVTDMFFLTARK
ncbi:MAG: carboxy terminal-processing peptidase [Ignavibacteria bacterium]|jgi:carboxyl-terminal processing protease|nr:carboxy terminal-processing peptidase [Ignavibacteria bacterium]MCU7502785.1 carboxy terminal-processing peptidase [Ignavibacteria bacterium]MCU7518375.1 carboxy terminal-processing peptidase [Ignavibacteria bacterium]